LALVPKDQDKGAVILLNFSSETRFRIYYNTSTGTDSSTYSIDGNSARFFKADFDRSAASVSGVNGLVLPYDSVSPSITGNRLFMHSMVGLRMKVSFPYLKNFLFQPDKGHVLVNRAILEVPILSSSNDALRETTAIVAVRTDVNGKLLKCPTLILWVLD
jgi:hypothetical protein